METSIELAKGITIKQYLEWKKQKNRSKIAQMVYKRLFERYLKPYSFPDEKYKYQYKHGFAMMGSACLLIETYMSFKNGVKDTKGHSRDFFCQFFNSENDFAVFRDNSKNIHDHYLPSKFYSNVRCGILHQGETKEGWTITRKKNEKLFDSASLKINATKFTQKLDTVLKNYKSQLETMEWESDMWKNTRKKLKFIIENCQKQTS